MMAWRVVTLEILQGALGDEREHFCRWCKALVWRRFGQS